MTAILVGAIECGGWALLTGWVLWTHQPWDLWFCVAIGALRTLGAIIRLAAAIDEA